MGPQQSVIAWKRFPVHKGLGNVAALGEFGLYPIRVDVASETGDKLMLLATFEVKEAFRI
ncbi:hypothetical protein D9M73_257530 [compost metagenome]